MDRCVCFIVPPHVLEQVVRTGSREERELALDTLSLDAAIRTARVQQAALPAPWLGTGLRLSRSHGGAGRPRRTIYDAEHTTNVEAATVLRHEGHPPGPDQAADEAYDGLGDTYALFWDRYRRDSIDGMGMPLLGEVHFGVDYDNAFWDGQRMMFGDGDGRLFTGFTKAVDVIGHELTHGVTERTLGLRYVGQSGALNESVSDVFGSLVKQHRLGQTADRADWLLGAGILGPAMPGQALRSLKAPGTAYEGDPQPATMASYVRTSSDNGGVHINSGIPNRAFYLTAVGLGGHAWEAAGRIWYQTLAQRAVTPDAHFAAFATATEAIAGQLFGPGSSEAQAVGEAWREVGVL